MSSAQILLVEDEEVTRFNLKALFEAEGYAVHEAIDGPTMEAQLQAHKIDLVILDINLPGKNGLILARELKSNHNLGLMFLSGRDSDIDKILGLEIGADDYLTKPFNPRELTIRARNLLSRVHAQPEEKPVSVVNFHGWTLDANARQMTSPSQNTITIPRGEYRALRLLMEHRGEIVSRQDLIKEMTGRDLRPNDRTVDVTIRRLRKHFESDTETPELISTIHGEGYRFVGQLD